MPMSREHDLHNRRWGRNVGLAVTLGAFIVLVFGLTIAKVQGGGEMQGFDHTYRYEIDPEVAADIAAHRAATEASE